MIKKPAVCVEIEEDLLAAAVGEAGPSAAERVDRHLAICAPCRREFEEYRAVDGMVGALQSVPVAHERVAEAQAHLESRLADLRSRMLHYHIFPSPLGHILIARSELGISLVEYLEHGKSLKDSQLFKRRDVDVVKGGEDLETTSQELLEYLEGRRKRLDWPLDLRLVGSDFHRAVLAATAAIPYGAVIPYAGIAQELGKARATRAVAQALRRNPLPIVIPCHRVIGTSGDLTGYAGNKITLKQKLLSIEGVPIAKHGHGLSIAPQTMYALYPGEREYCLPTCPSFERQRPAPLTRFATRADAEAAGFAPCTLCRPDLHPLSH